MGQFTVILRFPWPKTLGAEVICQCNQGFFTIIFCMQCSQVTTRGERTTHNFNTSQSWTVIVYDTVWWGSLTVFSYMSTVLNLEIFHCNGYFITILLVNIFSYGHVKLLNIWEFIKIVFSMPGKDIENMNHPLKRVLFVFFGDIYILISIIVKSISSKDWYVTCCNFLILWVKIGNANHLLTRSCQQ